MNFTFDHAVMKGASLLTKDFVIYQGFTPYQYSNPKEELMGARERAWFGCYLNMALMGRTEIWGPDAGKFLNQVCVNRDFTKLKIGGSRHALICNEKGQLMNTGIVTRITDDLFRTYCLFPTIVLLSSKKLGKTGEVW